MQLNMQLSSRAVLLLWFSLCLTSRADEEIEARQVFAMPTTSEGNAAPEVPTMAPSAPAQTTPQLAVATSATTSSVAAPPPAGFNEADYGVLSGGNAPPETTTRCVTTVTYTNFLDGTFTIYHGKTTSTITSKVSCPATTCSIIAKSAKNMWRPTATKTTNAGKTVTAFVCRKSLTQDLFHGGPMTTSAAAQAAKITTAITTSSAADPSVPLMVPRMEV